MCGRKNNYRSVWLSVVLVRPHLPYCPFMVKRDWEIEIGPVKMHQD